MALAMFTLLAPPSVPVAPAAVSPGFGTLLRLSSVACCRAEEIPQARGRSLTWSRAKRHTALAHLWRAVLLRRENWHLILLRGRGETAGALIISHPQASEMQPERLRCGLGVHNLSPRLRCQCVTLNDEAKYTDTRWEVALAAPAGGRCQVGSSAAIENFVV